MSKTFLIGGHALCAMLLYIEEKVVVTTDVLGVVEVGPIEDER